VVLTHLSKIVTTTYASIAALQIDLEYGVSEVQHGTPASAG
jgi:hypothetical protein